MEFLIKHKKKTSAALQQICLCHSEKIRPTGKECINMKELCNARDQQECSRRQEKQYTGNKKYFINTEQRQQTRDTTSAHVIKWR